MSRLLDIRGGRQQTEGEQQELTVLRIILLDELRKYQWRLHGTDMTKLISRASRPAGPLPRAAPFMELLSAVVARRHRNGIAFIGPAMDHVPQYSQLMFRHHASAYETTGLNHVGVAQV